MTSRRRRTASIEFPNDLDIVITREFEAPMALVFDVLTKPEHMRHTLAPFDEEITELSVDFRVGSDDRYTFVTDDGRAMTFSGTFLEIEPPRRSAQTWLCAGWPDAGAVESVDLTETDGVTTMTHRLSFCDLADRAHMTKYEGLLANFELVEDHLWSLIDSGDAVSR